VTPHREAFSRLLDELGVLLVEIDRLRTVSARGGQLEAFDQGIEMFGVKDWPGLLAANDEPIVQWHVEQAELMIELAWITLRWLGDRPPPTPHAGADAPRH